ARDLAALPLDRDEVVADVLRRGPAVDLAHDVLGGVEAAARRAVILASGLERDFLDRPPHRPIDAPGQLEVAAAPQVDPGAVLARTAGRRHAPCPVPGEVEIVAPARGAESGEREPRVVEQRPRAVGSAGVVEDAPDRLGVFERLADALGVGALAVARVLADELRLDPERREAAL